MSERCPADFTAYCQAGHLGLSSDSICRRRSKVNKRVAWFAKGRARHRVRSQTARVRPLGEPASSTSSEDELPGPLYHYASAEELAALRGCVRRTRALFSPPPPPSPPPSSPDQAENDEGHNVARDHAPSSQGTTHLRQDSFEYDHLEDPCSVSVEFISSGYEQQLVGGAWPRTRRHSSESDPHHPDWRLPSSLSSPERLNSPSFLHHQRDRFLDPVGVNCSSWPKGLVNLHPVPAHLSPMSRLTPSPTLLPSSLPHRYTPLPSPRLGRRDLGSACSSSMSLCPERQREAEAKGIDGAKFKEQTDLFLGWFKEFSEQQKNIALLKMLEQCQCAQLHLLSVHMEPILHRGCPHNCQDLLSWLPPHITSLILSYLDPVSLARASQVNRSWLTLTSDSLLWETLCSSHTWRLSHAGTAKHRRLFCSEDGRVQWKAMFAERFRLRRNWLNGYCNVRTFEGHTQGISCIQFDDTRIVSGSWDKTIKVWNRRTNTAWAALTLAGHSGTVRCLHLHGNRLVSGSSDRTIKVWDLSTDNVGWVGATCRATMVGHMHTVRCLQADDEKVVSGSYDLTLKVWDVTTGQCRLTLRGHTDAVLCLQFDGERLVSGSKDMNIKVWSLAGGRCQLTLHGHEGAVTCLQFDSKRIVSGALDRVIKIWDISTGECVRTMDWIRSEGHTGVVRHLQADSWKIVSAADDKTLKVWSVESGERLLTLKSHTDGVTCLQFNDEIIVSGSYDKTVRLWDFSAC